MTIENRIFYAGDTFGAFHKCEEWLRKQGCSIGSMQRGAPIGVIFETEHLISKYRNLGKDAKDMHGWIKAVNGSFRDGDIVFTVTPLGEAFLSQIEERSDDATAPNSADA